MAMTDIYMNNELFSLNKVAYKLAYNNQYIDIEDLQAVTSHIHNCVELYFNISGEVSFLVKDRIYPINRGDLILTRENEFHHCIYHTSCTHEHVCLWIGDDPSNGLLAFIRDSDCNHLVFSWEEKEEMISLLQKAYSATTQDQKFAATTYILQILLMIKQRLADPLQESLSILPKDFQTILNYINTNYSDLTNVCQLTDRFFISPATLNRRFYRHLHISPKSYLESVKLSNAKRMLDEGKSVTKVCFDCGYSDCSHFIRSFKRKFGITPHKYQSQGAI